ncbi:MAG: type II toxin-antitoxin system RelE/ParE family toxin [Thaumarchaeota archaeon]|nr:MAG: type II toxin-antitoxin system RelE/ParE family toxin [Nitrososphaerota archaeon]
MAYNIFITDTAKKQLAKIDRQTAKRIDKKLREISHEPFLYVSKLSSLDLYKLRVGDYRVLMNIQKDRLIILVVEISHRRNVYK